MRINPKDIPILTFLLGAGCGALLSAISLKSKYKKKKEAEILEIREWYIARDKKRHGGEKRPVSAPVESKEKEVTPFDMKDYQKKVALINREQRYSKRPTVREIDESEELEDRDDDVSHIYSIPPELFGTKEDYSTVFLTYYADGVLVDDAGDIMSIASEGGDDLLTIPQEIIDHIGEYIEDVAHCRNDNLGIDYEITVDPRTYSSIPKPREGNYE